MSNHDPAQQSVQHKLLRDKHHAAKRLGCKPATLDAWFLQGKGPKAIKIGRLRRYRDSDLDEFIESGLRCSTSDKGAQ
jgi:predicted DNA-binding transcriptional regulator AlpA